MAFFGSGLGVPNFFSMSQPINGIMCEAVVLNVLRSLQFSYLLMKGFNSTSRALRETDIFPEDGMDIGGGRRCRSDRGGWRCARKTGSGAGRGGMSRGTGLRSTGRSSRMGNGVIKGGYSGGKRGRGRHIRCADDDVDVSRARGSQNVRNAKRNGSPARSGCENDSGKNSTSGQVNSQSGDSGLPAQNLDDGLLVVEGSANGAVPEGSTSMRMETTGSEISVAKVVFSGVTIPRLGLIEGTLERLKSMKIFVTSVKVVAGVVGGAKKATKVVRRFHTPISGVLLGVGAGNGYIVGFEMARYVVKGAKFSRDFAKVWRSSRTWLGIRSRSGSSMFGAIFVKEKFLKGLKISDGALTVVKVVKDFGSGLGGTLHHGVTNWDLMSRGYDVSNGIMKVVEGVIGLKGGGVIGLVGKGFTVVKGVVVGMGMSGKVLTVMVFWKKIALAGLKGFGFSKTLVEAVKTLGEEERFNLSFAGKSEEAVKESDLTAKRRPAFLNRALDGGVASRTTETMMALAQKRGAAAPAAIHYDVSSSMMFSLASLLVAGCDQSPIETANTVGSSGNIFLLSLPS